MASQHTINCVLVVPVIQDDASYITWCGFKYEDLMKICLCKENTKSLRLPLLLTYLIQSMTLGTARNLTNSSCIIAISEASALSLRAFN